MRLRLRQIALVAEKLEPVVDDLRSVLGLEVCYRDPGVERFGLENALVPDRQPVPRSGGADAARHRGRPLPRAARRRRRLHGDHPVRRPRAAPPARRGARHPHRDAVRDRALPQHAAPPQGHRRLVLRDRSAARSRRLRRGRTVGPRRRRRLEARAAAGSRHRHRRRRDPVARSDRDRRALVRDRADPDHA